MSNIISPTVSSDDFIATIYHSAQKPIFFWDTCSLLDIIRLPYRQWDLESLKSVLEIKALIDADLVYSVCSELTIQEWNDNFTSARSGTTNSLKATSDYHGNCISMINHLFGTNLVSENLTDKGFVEELVRIAVEITQKTHFITIDKIAGDALRRVAQKAPPSKKKPEFKDCAIWETVLDLSVLSRPYGHTCVYFTVNIEDYANRTHTPPIVLYQIASEAVTSGVEVALTFEQAKYMLV